MELYGHGSRYRAAAARQRGDRAARSAAAAMQPARWRAAQGARRGGGRRRPSATTTIPLNCKDGTEPFPLRAAVSPPPPTPPTPRWLTLLTSSSMSIRWWMGECDGELPGESVPASEAMGEVWSGRGCQRCFCGVHRVVDVRNLPECRQLESPAERLFFRTGEQFFAFDVEVSRSAPARCSLA